MRQRGRPQDAAGRLPYRRRVGRGRRRASSEIFRHNNLALRTRDFFTWGLAFGDSYIMVSPNPDDSGRPFITQEHPFECITSDDPITGAPRAALKLYHDDDLEEDRAYVFLPGQVHVATRGTGFNQPTSWDWNDGLSFALPNGLEDVIPVRHFRNENGTGDFEPHLDTLNRINETLFDRLSVQKYQAFSMRVFSGLPMQDGDGKDIDYSEIWSQDPGSVVTLGQITDDQDKPVSNAIQMFETTPVPMDPFRMAVLDDMKTFAVETSTPLHLITPDAAQGSAEGASLQREAGTWKTEDRRARGQQALAETMSLAFRFAGLDDRTDPTKKIEVIWAPPERYSLAESAAAAQQLRSAGIPLETIAETTLQMSPEEISRMNQQLADEALRAPVTAGEANQVRRVAPNLTSNPNGQEQVDDGNDARAAA